MYGKGNVLGAGCVVGSTCVTAAVLPQTGVNLAVQLALAAAAGLAVWAVAYMALKRFGRR